MNRTGELALLSRWRDRLPAIGDDCAVVAAPVGPLLLATDSVVAGVHVAPGAPAGVAARRAVLRNLSDVAAMGGVPLHVLLAVAAPEGTDLDAAIDGAARAAAEHGCELVGGDVAVTTGPLVVTVAITGTVEDGEPARRSGAQAGDAVYVSAPLGAAAASGWAREPEPRLRDGQRARREGATAMIDVSDGLALDLARLADESGVGFELEQVPMAVGATLDQALRGGDDYELLFTGPDTMTGIRIGTCVADRAVRTLRGERLDASGWEHRW